VAKNYRYRVVQRVTRDQRDDVLVSTHRTREAADRVVRQALPGDQPEMRVEDAGAGAES
jgi:hypothetical protein